MANQPEHGKQPQRQSAAIPNNQTLRVISAQAQSGDDDEEWAEETEEYQQAPTPQAAQPAAPKPTAALPDAAEQTPSPSHLPATSASAQAKKAGAGQPDWQALLEQNFPRRRRLIAPPPEEAFANLGAWLRWGGGLVATPFNWLLDDPTPAPEAESEPMSLLKREMYRFGGAVVWAWSAFITQSVTARLFPAVDSAITVTSGDFFKQGFNLSAKAFIAAAVFTFMLSVIETLVFDRNKSRFKKCLVVLAFTVDIGINSIGWADFLGHSKRFEWNPLAPVFRSEPIEWGSFFCELAAVLSACLPEIMWEKARRAKRRAKSAAHAGGGSQAQAGAKGVWVTTAKGMQFVTEEQLRQLANWQQGQGKTKNNRESR